MLCTAVKTKQALLGFVCYGTMLLLALGQSLASEGNANYSGSSESVVNETYQFLQTVQTPFVVNDPTFDFTGYQTYKVFVETMNSDDFVHRVYGDGSHNASFSAPSGIYNNLYCNGATSGQVPAANFFWGGYNAHTFDSWVGIGLTSFPDMLEGEVDVTVQQSAGSTWSDNFSLDFMSSGNYGAVDFSFEDVNTEGGWTLEDLNATNGFTGDDYRAIVMQVTSPATIVWTLNAEIYVHGDPSNVVLISQTFDGTSMGPVLIEGCIDLNACNYYDLATVDNGACVLANTFYDCDDVCLNDIDGDTVCDELEIPGCQDDDACNFNENATDNNGTCIYATGCETCSGETDGTGATVGNDIDDDGVCNADEVIGCQDAIACNYDDQATNEGACIYVDGICESCSGETDGTGTTVDNDSDNDTVCDVDEVVGCEDPLGCNYNSAATDSGACIYVDGVCETCSGESDGTGTIVGNDSDDDSVCDSDEVIGCQDALACNYNTIATDAGDCVFVDGICDTCSGENDGTGTVIDNDSDDDAVCDVDEIDGCQDEAACNFMSNATDDGVDCVFATGPCDVCIGSEVDGTGTVLDRDEDNDLVCNDDELIGCQDQTACNYNSAATDAGSCVFVDGICETCSGESDGTGAPVDNDSDEDGVCNADEVIGCQDALACNYNSAATDTGTCVFVEGICETCSGESDGTGAPVDNDSDDDGVCDADELVGCQDALACNYNSAATDAGTCLFVDGLCETCSGESDGTGAPVDNDSDDDGVCDADELVGCQEALACNYNSAATDAGTCVFLDGVCETCSGESDGTGAPIDNDSDDDGVCDADELVGCQEALACNYNSAATDPGVCVFVDGICETCSGESDGTGTPVNNDSDDDGVCNEDEVIGCHDDLACNYNSAATDAGTCVFAEGCESCSGATDGTGTTVDNDSDNDDICNVDEIEGCQDEEACNFMNIATDAGVCAFATGPCDVCIGSDTDGSGTVLDLDEDNDLVCNADEISGCQNMLACNFMASATDNAGCVYPVECETCSGESDGTGSIVSNDDDDDGICNEDEIEGCFAPLACNYNTAATDSGPCVFAEGCESCSGATDGSGSIVNNDSDGDGICDADEVVGCQDQQACNYVESATDPGECYVAGVYYDCSGNCLNDEDANGVCDEIDLLLNDAAYDGFLDGYDFGVGTCLGSAFCGEGTVWNEDFQLCVEDSSCPGDLNDDLVVGTGDLLLLLTDYGFYCNE